MSHRVPARSARWRRPQTGQSIRRKAALRQAADLPYFQFRDECHLLFAEPLEAARIAILSGDYIEALTRLAVAESNVTETVVADSGGNVLHKPPVQSARRAELQLLRGAAMLGLEWASRAQAGTSATTSARSQTTTTPSREAEAQALITQALKVPDQLAADLAPAERAQFLKQFDAWRKLAEPEKGQQQ